MSNLRKLPMISMITAILLCTCIAPSVAEVLSFSPGVNMDNVSTAFLQEHPNVELITDGIWYDTTSELVGVMLTRSFQGDIFALNTMAKDLSILYKHGYCLDLSSSSIISEAIARMHPAIAQQVMFDGGIYGVPTMISFNFQIVHAASWEACGYTDADVPQSFPQLLSFLDGWCDRLEKEGNAEYRSFGGFDGFYSPSSYTQLLLGYLIDEVVLQSNYANVPVYFDEKKMVHYWKNVSELASGSMKRRRLLRACTEEAHRYSLPLFSYNGLSVWKKSCFSGSMIVSPS